MKKVLFASTAFAALAVGGAAFAQGITLYGSARLGLYYNDDADNKLQTTSRTRFGVTMTGETDSGITFGADMRADQVVDGSIDAADNGRAGSAFVSGAFGTLTFGDTNGADEQWVGDLYGDFSLTGLNDWDETIFISNGGSLDDDDFVANPNARPTVRYDFDIAGFGLSLSSDHSLNDVGVGAGYAGSFGGFDLSIGAGYYNFKGFEVTSFGGYRLDPVTNEVVEITDTFTGDDGDQWSAMVGFGAGDFDMNVIYTSVDFDGPTDWETLGVGAQYSFDALSVGAYYTTFISGSGGADDWDGDDAYEFSAMYDLGGGASVKGGIQDNFSDTVVADFGIDMAF